MRRLLLIVLLAFPAPAVAQEGSCLMADPPPLTKPAQPLRMGVFPLAAGTAGPAQGQVAPVDEAAALGAAQRLQPPGRRLVMRLNRLFQADGAEGIAKYVGIADGYARAGFDVESQIRYHPAAGDEGDMDKWEAYVRSATAALARNPALVELSITNEVNLPISGNTSDGSYPGAIDAVLRGVPAAREVLDAMGREDVVLGFSYAWRYTPDADLEFWREIGAKATPEFKAALDHVGLQVYPGLFWPPVLTPDRTAGAEVLEALTVLRTCYLREAGLDGVDLWITENGYATNLGHGEARQAAELRSTLDDVARYSGELGVTDYRYFNLRDNNSDGTDLFAAVGLLHDDYAETPAFGVFRELVEKYGEEARPRTCVARVWLPRGRYRRVIVRVDGVRVEHARKRRRVSFVVAAGANHVVRVRAVRRGGRVVRVTRRGVHC